MLWPVEANGVYFTTDRGWQHVFCLSSWAFINRCSAPGRAYVRCSSRLVLQRVLSREPFYISAEHALCGSRSLVERDFQRASSLGLGCWSRPQIGPRCSRPLGATSSPGRCPYRSVFQQLLERIGGLHAAPGQQTSLGSSEVMRDSQGRGACPEQLEGSQSVLVWAPQAHDG